MHSNITVLEKVPGELLQILYPFAHQNLRVKQNTCPCGQKFCLGAITLTTTNNYISTGKRSGKVNMEKNSSSL